MCCWFRYRALTTTTAITWFELLQKAFDLCKTLSGGVELTADRVWNMDESGFDETNSSNKGWVFVRRGTKEVRRVVSGDREHISVAAFVNAAGGALPPAFIFNGQRCADAVRKFIEEQLKAKFWMNESGYMTDVVCDFLDVLRCIALLVPMYCIFILMHCTSCLSADVGRGRGVGRRAHGPRR